MSEEYHLTESRNDEQSNLMIVKNLTNPSKTNLNSIINQNRPSTTLENNRAPGFGRQESRGLIPKAKMISQFRTWKGASSNRNKGERTADISPYSTFDD